MRRAPQVRCLVTALLLGVVPGQGMLLAGDASRTRGGGRSDRPAVTVTGRATYGHARPGRFRHGPSRYYHHGPYYRWHAVPYGFYAYPWWWGAGPYYPYGPPRYPRFYAADGAPALVETDVRPRKAAVRIDGDLAGRARDFDGRWDYLRLPAGRHRLEFELEGYRLLRLDLDVREGSYHRLAYRLERGEGLDPRSQAREERRELPAADERRRAPRDAPSRPVSGLLRVHVEPSDAVVYLDGEFLGRGDELARLRGALPVAPGAHRLEVVRPGYRPHTVEVTVDAAEPAEVRVRLRREAPAATPDSGDPPPSPDS